MSKWLTLLLIATVVLGVAPVRSSQAQDDPLPIAITDECQTAVRAMNDLLAEAQQVPDHLRAENAAKRPGDFDANRFFEALDHLTMEDGYILDYVYLYDGTGGQPILYAYPADQTPLATLKEFSNYFWIDEDDTDPTILDYRYHIEIDDTPAGYLQMVILDTLGSQFYLFWHANYNDWQIICDEAMLADVFENTRGGIPAQTQEAATAYLTPTVTLYEDYAEVRLVAFSMWSGLIEWTVSITRDFPHEFGEWHDVTLIEYDSGIMF